MLSKKWGELQESQFELIDIKTGDITENPIKNEDFIIFKPEVTQSEQSELEKIIKNAVKESAPEWVSTEKVLSQYFVFPNPNNTEILCVPHILGELGGGGENAGAAYDSFLILDTKTNKIKNKVDYIYSESSKEFCPHWSNNNIVCYYKNRFTERGECLDLYLADSNGNSKCIYYPKGLRSFEEVLGPFFIVSQDTAWATYGIEDKENDFRGIVKVNLTTSTQEKEEKPKETETNEKIELPKEPIFKIIYLDDSNLCVMNSDGSGRKTLAKSNLPEELILVPSLSPDELKVAYWLLLNKQKGVTFMEKMTRFVL